MEKLSDERMLELMLIIDKMNKELEGKTIH